jgi:hypothetical protein
MTAGEENRTHHAGLHSPHCFVFGIVRDEVRLSMKEVIDPVCHILTYSGTTRVASNGFSGARGCFDMNKMIGSDMMLTLPSRCPGTARRVCITR